MLENSPENDLNIKLNRAITEKTRPDTVSNQYNGPIFYNNLNSVLKNVDEEHCVKYIDMPRMETAKINSNNMVKDITPKEEDSNKNKLCLNTNIKKGSKKNIDLYFLPKRLDRFGCPILKGGKQRVTFIDKITKTNFVEVIKIESFKEFNKMEEIKSSNHRNTCYEIICFISFNFFIFSSKQDICPLDFFLLL